MKIVVSAAPDVWVEVNIPGRSYNPDILDDRTSRAQRLIAHLIGEVNAAADQPGAVSRPGQLTPV